MPFSLLSETAGTLDENLALDEALLLAAEAGESGEVLRFWEWPTPAIVLGAGGSIAIDVNKEAASDDSVPIHRRASGGGTVLVGRGCLLFSLVLAYERAAPLRDVNASYCWILGKVASALRAVATVEMAGISDLAVDGRKFSGNAQQRKSRCLLHHGTLMYAFDLAAIGRYLKSPEREPDYRAGRDHGAFVVNLSASARDLQDAIAMEFGAEVGVLPPAAVARVPGLIQERYGRTEWIRRR